VGEFQDFVFKICTTSLTLYLVSVRTKTHTQEESLIAAQRRSLIIELLKYIILLKSYEMN
jgi:hypothetical protein